MAAMWEKMLRDAAEEDAERKRRDIRIVEKNLKVKWVRVTFYIKNENGTRTGFGMDDYELPFGQKRMKDNIGEWKMTEFADGFDQEVLDDKSSLSKEFQSLKLF